MTKTLDAKKDQTTAFSSPEEIKSNVKPALAFEDHALVDPRWDLILRKLVSYFDYEDDWDGMDAVAADPDVINAAIHIALTLRNALHPAPDAVDMSCNGTITFETADSESNPFPVTTLEVLSPTEAELYIGGRIIQKFEIAN